MSCQSQEVVFKIYASRVAREPRELEARERAGRQALLIYKELNGVRQRLNDTCSKRDFIAWLSLSLC